MSVVALGGGELGSGYAVGIVPAVRGSQGVGRVSDQSASIGRGNGGSGPDAAISGAFVGKAVVITDPEHSDKIVLEKIESIFSILGLHILKMSSADHDLHAAYVSHISHITSFALANTVLEKEREEDTIFQLASGGFESTVRLAKSNPAMWVPIFMQNKENVLDVLN